MSPCRGRPVSDKTTRPSRRWHAALALTVAGEPSREPKTVSYLDRARELRPRVAAAADQIDRERRIPEPLVDALHDAGFFRLLLPRSFDGGELDPALTVD